MAGGEAIFGPSGLLMELITARGGDYVRLAGEIQ